MVAKHVAARGDNAPTYLPVQHLDLVRLLLDLVRGTGRVRVRVRVRVRASVTVRVRVRVRARVRVRGRVRVRVSGGEPAE